jgi:hypothetical protein
VPSAVGDESSPVALADGVGSIGGGYRQSSNALAGRHSARTIRSMATIDFDNQRIIALLHRP